MTPVIRPIAVLVMCSVMSCNGTERRQAQGPSMAPASRPATDGHSPLTRAVEPDRLDRHWLQNDQLASLMRDISASTQRNWPENVPRPRSDLRAGDLEQAMRSAAALADELAASADRIPVAVERVEMSAADRVGFTTESQTLRKQAQALATAARTGDSDGMRVQLDAISSTCISCHSRFRDFAGELSTQRARSSAMDNAVVAAK